MQKKLPKSKTKSAAFFMIRVVNIIALPHTALNSGLILIGYHSFDNLKPEIFLNRIQSLILILKNLSLLCHQQWFCHVETKLSFRILFLCHYIDILDALPDTFIILSAFSRDEATLYDRKNFEMNICLATSFWTYYRIPNYHILP